MSHFLVSMHGSLNNQAVHIFCIFYIVHVFFMKLCSKIDTYHLGLAFLSQSRLILLASYHYYNKSERQVHIPISHLQQQSRLDLKCAYKVSRFLFITANLKSALCKIGARSPKLREMFDNRLHQLTCHDP